MSVPIRKYRGFDSDFTKLPEACQGRFNTFIKLLSLDPDDESVLQICGHDAKGRLAYPLGSGWVVYWAVVRERTQFTTLHAPRPLQIDLYAFALFDEFERVDVVKREPPAPAGQ